MAKHISSDGAFTGIHAGKNQDIENDVTHSVGDDIADRVGGNNAVDVVDYISSSAKSAPGDDGPSTLNVWDDTDIAHISSPKQIAGSSSVPKISGDWNGDGPETVGSAMRTETLMSMVNDFLA